LEDIDGEITEEIIKTMGNLEGQKKINQDLLKQIALLKVHQEQKEERSKTIQSEVFIELQEKYNQLLEEREQLRIRLKREEENVIKLQMEVETIPEYIELYHKERGILKTKAAEKDKIILQLVDFQERNRKELIELRKSLQELSQENERLKSFLQTGDVSFRNFEDDLNDSGDYLQRQNSFFEESVHGHQSHNGHTEIDLHSTEFNGLAKIISKHRSSSINISFPPCEHCKGASFDI